MKNTEKNVALVAAGIMLGTAIAGPAAQAAEMLAAQRSAQKIVVDGKPVQIEAYSINGNNYVKIRDLGKAVDFNVSYDAATNTVHICTDEPYTEELQAQASRTVTLPTDGSKYVPKVGDLIPCDDGTTYEVKDVIRWENNVFMDGPMPDMPTPTCDWSLFPQLELPKVEARHFSDEHGDDLFVRNLYEMRRMIYTIYNAIGEEPDAWRDGKPLCKIYTEIPPEYESYTGVFWPWRSSEITKAVHALPNTRYYVDAWDYFHDGAYQHTRYCLMQI